MRSPKNIMQRESTLVNEFSKCLGYLPALETPSAQEVKLRTSLLNLDGICEYCESRKATTEDHFFPLVQNGFPTDACNDFWNLVPVCKECNSSKGNKTIQEWKESAMNPNSKSKFNPFKVMRKGRSAQKMDAIYKKLVTYGKHAEKYRKKKRFNITKLRAVIKMNKQHLTNMQRLVDDIKQTTQYKSTSPTKRSSKN